MIFFICMKTYKHAQLLMQSVINLSLQFGAQVPVLKIVI